MPLPYPIPDPATGEWDPFALKANLEYLDRFTAGTAFRTLSLQTGSVNTSGTGETTLFTYTLDPNRLALDGQRLECYVSGSTDAGGAVKQLKFYFGGTELLGDATSASNADFIIMARIIRLGSASQLCVVWDTVDQAVNNATTQTTTHDMATSIVISMTGQTTDSNQPITGKSFELLWLPA